MPGIADQVVDFYDELFRRVFLARFEGQISNRLHRRAVARDIAESADAASQSLTRFFLHQRLTDGQAGEVLSGLARLCDWIELDVVSHPNLAPNLWPNASTRTARAPMKSDERARSRCIAWRSKPSSKCCR